LPQAAAKSTDKPATAAKPALKTSVEKPGLAAAQADKKPAAKPAPKQAAVAPKPSQKQATVTSKAVPKKSVDKPVIALAKPMTKPVHLAKVDPLAPLPAKHSGHSRDTTAD
jgi:hypothetical protein